MRVAMQIEVAIAAGATNENVFTGQQYQTIPFNALLALFDTGSAAGLRRTMTVSGRTVLDRGIVSAQNRVPIPDQDVVVSDVEAYQGQQVFVTVQNPTAGSLTYRGTLWIEQAA